MNGRYMYPDSHIFEHNKFLFNFAEKSGAYYFESDGNLYLLFFICILDSFEISLGMNSYDHHYSLQSSIFESNIADKNEYK